jgi:hypothetical protein
LRYWLVLFEARLLSLLEDEDLLLVLLLLFLSLDDFFLLLLPGFARQCASTVLPFLVL